MKNDSLARPLSPMRKILGGLASPLLYLSFVLAPFSPLPIGIVTLLNGVFWAFLIWAVGFALIFVGAGPQNSLFYALTTAPVGLGLGIALKRGWTPERGILFSTLLGIFLTLGALFFASQRADQSVSQYLEDSTQKGVQYIQEIYEKNQEQTGSENKEITQLFKDFKEKPEEMTGMVKREILPNLFYFFGLISWLNCILLAWFSRRIPDISLKWPSDYFLTWRSPEKLIWVAIASGACVVFQVKPVLLVADPLLKILIFIYFLQGISILAFLFHRFRTAAPIRIFGYVLLLTFAKSFIAAIGFFDLWWDIRKKLNSGGQSNESHFT